MLGSWTLIDCRSWFPTVYIRVYDSTASHVRRKDPSERLLVAAVQLSLGPDAVA